MQTATIFTSVPPGDHFFLKRFPSDCGATIPLIPVVVLRRGA
jgi:hypothetical protein